MNKGLYKKAANALTSLQEERDQLQSQLEETKAELEKHATAHDLTFRLWKMGAFPAEELEDRFHKLLKKTNDDINNFEKAASFISSGAFNLELGELSDIPQLGGTAEERFISRLFE